MNEVVVGVDIGSSKVCTIIGEYNRNNQIQILGVGTSECKGLKKGIIVDIDNAVEAIKNSIDQAERMSNMEINHVFINIAGGHTSLIKNKGIVAVSNEDMEVTPDDVVRAFQAVRIINLPADREIIGVIPLQFIVDGYDHIKDPVGMIGSRLEVEAYVVTAASVSVQNLVRSVERCGIEVSGIVIDPLASSEVILSRDEKEMGTALVDVGGEITDISIFQGENIVFTKVIPIGGCHITNDISIGLKIPVSEAESIKRQYGLASVSMLKSEESIKISSMGGSKTLNVSNRQLVDIMEARVQEIYDLINRVLKESGYKDSISGGVVITGGGLSFIKGSVEVGSAILGLPVRIGMPTYIGVASPIYSTGTGIVKYILSSQKNRITGKHIDDEEEEESITKIKKQTVGKGSKILNKIKDFFTDFF